MTIEPLELDKHKKIINSASIYRHPAAYNCLFRINLNFLLTYSDQALSLDLNYN